MYQSGNRSRDIPHRHLYKKAAPSKGVGLLSFWPENGLDAIG